MLTGKKIKKEAESFGETAFKAVSIQYLLFTFVTVQILVVILSTKGSLFPGEETIKSIAGTGAEIIAGLYGLTLAGYTFFLSRIDALMASDGTLDYVVSSIKNRFKYLIWFITSNAFLSLMTSLLLLYCPAPASGDHVFYYRLFCNEFIVFFGFSVVLMLYYSILVIDPNCIEKEARKLKKRISRQKLPAGDAVEFISLYDRIEAHCNRMLPANVLNQIHDNKGRHFEYTLELLQEQRALSLPLVYDLKRIHRYYECAVNCTPLSVSAEMCILARHVLSYLEQSEDLCVKTK